MVWSSSFKWSGMDGMDGMDVSSPLLANNWSSYLLADNWVICRFRDRRIYLAGLSELFLVGGCVKKVGGCEELKTEREGGLHARFLHLN